MQLADYYFAHQEMFVIPIEHLSPSGMSAAYQTILQKRAAVPTGWTELFNASFALYWARATELMQRAPSYWFPPRLQHCCIVRAGARVRPYFQPFNQCAWLLYECDFDPTVSNVEFAAYLFLHMERMGLLRDVTATLLRNLSYWLIRSDAESDAFGAACGRARRPDAAAFRTLAEALVWVRRLHHESLRAPAISVAGPAPIPHTGLLLSREQQPRLNMLVRRWSRAAQDALDAFHMAYARQGRDQAGALCTWLCEQRPQVLVTADDGRIVWDPDRPENLAAVRSTLGGIGTAAAASIRDDLLVIDAHTRRLLATLVHPEQLPSPHADVAQDGLCYMHRTRRQIAYNVRETGMERLRVPAPPYERFMLGARTVHEWGHLAADAGWIAVPEERRTAEQHLVEDLAERFEFIYTNAPSALRHLTQEECTRLAATHGSVGRGLASIALARLPDFQANLLARHFLSVSELETYVRNNVHTLKGTLPPAAVFQRLARYAYEYQYLRFSQLADPWRYFLSSTWFEEDYLTRRVLSEDDMQELTRLIGAICDLHAIDMAQFRF